MPAAAGPSQAAVGLILPHEADRRTAQLALARLVSDQSHEVRVDSGALAQIQVAVAVLEHFDMSSAGLGKLVLDWL